MIQPIRLNLTWNSQTKTLEKLDLVSINKLYRVVPQHPNSQVKLIVTCVNSQSRTNKLKNYEVTFIDGRFVCCRSSAFRKFIKAVLGRGGDLSLALSNHLDENYKAYKTHVYQSNSRSNAKGTVVAKLVVACKCYKNKLLSYPQLHFRDFKQAADYSTDEVVCLKRFAGIIEKVLDSSYNSTSNLKGEIESFWDELYTYINKLRNNNVSLLSQELKEHFDAISDNFMLDSDDSAKIICDSLFKLMYKENIDLDWNSN